MCPTTIVHHFAIVLYQFGDIIGVIVTIIVSVTPQNSSAVNECMPCTHGNCLSRAFCGACASRMLVVGTLMLSFLKEVLRHCIYTPELCNVSLCTFIMIITISPKYAVQLQ